MHESDYLTAEEAGPIVGVSPATILSWARAGRVASYKPSPKLVYFRRRDLQEYVKKNSRPALAGRAH
jgi:excisionase family DNA binding protein